MGSEMCIRDSLKVEHMFSCGAEKKSGFWDRHTVILQIRFRNGGNMMQTLYYTTHNFVRRSGNVIDLCEYRSRMQDVQEEPVSAAPAARTERTRRRHPHQNAFALLMDSFASMSVILMTLTFTFWVLDKL